MRKKKAKFIISAITSVLCIATIGVSYALYKIEPDPVEFNLYTTSTKDVQYVIKDVGEDDGILNPEQSVTNSFTLAGEKHTGSPYTQNIIVGDFDIVLAVPNLNYVQALVDGGSYIYLDINADEDGANIEGEYYKEKVYFESGGGTTGNYKVRAQFRNIPVYLTGTHGRFVRKIAVGGENQVTYIDYINDIAGIPANEIKMSWHHADGFEYAYVIGNMLGSNWTPGVARFQMVPDPKHTWFQWMYETTFKVGDEFSTAKVENDGNIILAPNDNIIIGQNGQYPGKGIVIWQNVFVPPTWGPI